MSKYHFILKVFLTLILPLIISIFFLFPFNERIELGTMSENNETYKFIPDAQIREPGFINSVKNVFDVPFELDRYDVCFEDLGSKADDFTHIFWTVTVDNRTTGVVEIDDKWCTFKDSSEKFSYFWQLNVSIKFSRQANIHNISPDTTSYAQPEKFSLVTKYLIFLISWNLICSLFDWWKKYIKE